MTGSPREPTRRLFFALWPSEAERDCLAAATQAAVQAAGGRAIPRGSLHATLAFIGSVAEARTAALAGVGRAVAATWPGATPLVLTFGRLEYWRPPRILCALQSQESCTATALAQALRSAAAAAGFAPDLRPFRAHVTVARKVETAAASGAIAPVTWNADSFALIESRSVAGASVYSVLDSQLLVKAKKVHEMP